MIDPAQRALEKARERGLIVTDEPSGLSPSNPDPFRGSSSRIPVPYNASPTRRFDSSFATQPLSGPDTSSLHAALPIEKQAELAEALIKQQIEHNNQRFEREMQKEDQRTHRSRLMVFSMVGIAKWVAIIFCIGFVFLVGILGITGWKAGTLSDTSILTGIVNFFGTIIGALASNSGL